MAVMAFNPAEPRNPHTGEWVNRSFTGAIGDTWRAGLPQSDDELLRRWEKDPRAVAAGPERTHLRKLLATAPAVAGPVYRGDETKGGPYGIMPLDQQEDHFRDMMRSGAVVKFPRHTSTSTDPTVARGFGHTLYQIAGHGAKGIGNSLHEAVMPPGKYVVSGVERKALPSRAIIDARSVHTGDTVVVHLSPAQPIQLSMPAGPQDFPETLA